MICRSHKLADGFMLTVFLYLTIYIKMLSKKKLEKIFSICTEIC